MSKFSWERAFRTGTVVQFACQPGLLAPVWHSRALLLLLLGAPSVGLLLAEAPAADASLRATETYLASFAVGAALVAYVSRLGLGRNILGALVGQRWSSRGRALEDVLVGAGLCAWLLLADAELQRALGSPQSIQAQAALPTTATERAAWVGFALMAAGSEELVYRGYLLQQLSRLCRSPALGVALQALLFGIAHGEHGGEVVARYALHGAVLGFAALARGTLLPGMLAHAVVNLYAGLAR
jgi:uncharacterized protein